MKIQLHMYGTTGFVCEVLICVNYARNLRLIDFNSTVRHICLFQLSDCLALLKVLCLVICLTYVSLYTSTLKSIDIKSPDFAAAAGACPKALLCFLNHDNSSYSSALKI